MNGKTILLALFLFCGLLKTTLAQEMIPFLKDGKYGFADTTGKLIVSAIYDEVGMGVNYNYAFAKDSLWRIVNIKGKALKVFGVKKIPHRYNLKKVFRNSNSGNINYSGRDSSCLHLFVFKLSDSTYSIVNTRDLIYNGPYFIDGYSQKSMYLLKRMPNFFDHVGMLYGMRVVEKDKFKMNVIDTSGREILDRDYPFIKIVGPNRLSIYQDTTAALANAKGELITPFLFSNIEHHTDSLFYVSNMGVQRIWEYPYTTETEKPAGLIDYNGNLVIDTNYYSFTKINDDFIIVNKHYFNREHGIFNAKGETVIPIEYRYIRKLRDTLLLAWKDSTIIDFKLDLENQKIDTSSCTKVPFNLKTVYPEWGFYKIRTDSTTNYREGIVDKKGKIITPPKWKHANVKNPNLYLTIDEEHSYLFNIDGELIKGPFNGYLDYEWVYKEPSRYIAIAGGSAFLFDENGNKMIECKVDVGSRVSNRLTEKKYAVLTLDGKAYYLDVIKGIKFTD